MKKNSPLKTPLRDIMAYSTGDGATSLVMNAIAGFSMLYYTEALGLDYKLAGIALSISVFWDAITDPVMGHISDNTRSRYGRRHPYMLIGGIVMSVLFYFLWMVPSVFQNAMLFWYLVSINILLRTAITVFIVPFGALGFEVCTGYDDRSRLQGIRTAFSMAVNLAGPAMAHMIFFKDTYDGIEPKSVASNYINMGTAFSVAILFFVISVVFLTRRYMVDSRDNKEIVGNSVKSFFKDMKDIILSKYPRTVFVFTGVIIIGIVIVSSLQMYVYVHFMKLSSVQTTFAHGLSMVGMALGALLSPLIAAKFDKKPAVCVGVMVSVFSNIMLAVIFLTGWMSVSFVYKVPDGIFLLSGLEVPISVIVFVFFQAFYWFGNGIMMPLSTSMMADISEINKYETGVLKDGSYSAIFSFIFKTAMSIGLFFSGYCLDWTGFIAGSETQTPEAIRGITQITFIGGAVISAIAMLVILKYPVDKQYMQKIKALLAAQQHE